MTGLRRSGLTPVLAVLGGVVLLLGIGWLAAYGLMLRGTVFSLMGLILLWWAWSEQRKERPGTPESEADGSHTLE